MPRRWSKRRVHDLLRRVDLRSIWGTGKVLCPWHSDHRPSLHIYADHVFCYTCREAHSAIDYVQARYDLSFLEALAFLEPYRSKHYVQQEVRDGPPPEPVPLTDVRAWNQALLSNAWACQYLYDRGISRAAIKALLLGWKDDRLFVIPHLADGVVTNLKLRTHPDYLMDGETKYTSLAHRKFTHLYPYDVFQGHFSDSPTLFLCEGEFDSIILLQAGLPAVSLPSGADYKLTRWWSFLHRFQYIFVVFDMDKTGQEMVSRLFYAGTKTEHSEAMRLQVAHIEDVSWNPAWGKDVTDAREKLVPLLKGYYEETLLQL